MRVAIIKKYNASNQTTYVYDSVSYWDKEKQQPRSKRRLIGKIDPETGEIVPTAGRGRKPKAAVLETEGHEVRNTVENHADKTSGADPESTDPAAMYKECHRELLQTQAALAIAESRISALTAEKDSIARQLERILHQLKN
jgi:hypothetical protein